MNVRRAIAASATACLCFAAGEAAAQDRRAGPARPMSFDLRSLPPEAEPEERQRLRSEEPAGATRSGMIRSWALEPNMEFGLGRFQVGEIARARTNTERVRLERENRSIAGAGLRIRFD
jgi:hypothetical protein